ncbi:MAG: ankyrin repeat domain-containing protein [Azonexus sp.]|nr:ankyrin repeat domain-containing protein [Azonexus sp.]MDP3638596.1 ankyrin repeat domain-containing protein [Azonexus sp.]MDZ4315558.1 ankyrin repeat domain-containing protein [Azonexus sp.]
MDSQLILIKAIRSGRLSDVQAALDAGAVVELDDGQGDPGLPMGIACFMGFVDIVRELAKRGGKVDLPDNSLPTSPLNMAIRANRVEVVRALIELGAQVPDGMKTGLSEHDIMLAQWKAHRDGHVLGAADEEVGNLHAIEEIDVIPCFGTDTQVLEADVLRAIREGR